MCYSEMNGNLRIKKTFFFLPKMDIYFSTFVTLKEKLEVFLGFPFSSERYFLSIIYTSAETDYCYGKRKVFQNLNIIALQEEKREALNS